MNDRRNNNQRVVNNNENESFTHSSIRKNDS